MNDKTIKYIACALLSVSIIVPVIIIELFNFAMNGSFFSLGSLPKDSSAWSAFGSLLAGAFTLLGSIASLATLAFIYHQNKQSLDRADQQLKHTAEQIKDAKKINEQQSEFIKHQLLQMNYEFNRIQKKQFNELLNDLEAEHPSLKFGKRNTLYEKLFSEKTFLEKDKNNGEKNSGETTLIKVARTLDDIHTQITKRYYRDPRNTIISFIEYIKTELFISSPQNSAPGMILDNYSTPILNIYDLNSELDSLSDVVNSLMKFNGSDQASELNTAAVTSALKGSILNTLKQNPHYHCPENDSHLDTILEISFLADCLTALPKDELITFRQKSSNHSSSKKYLSEVEFELAIIELSNIFSEIHHLAQKKCKKENDINLLECINRKLKESVMELRE